MDGGMEGGGGEAERWSYHREGTGETQQAQLVGYPILDGEVPLYVYGGTQNWGTSYCREEGPPLWRDHPTQEKLSLPWIAGSSYHWQGAWGGGCQSPRLPDWNWSCHLTCCVGREAKELVSTGGRGAAGL